MNAIERIIIFGLLAIFVVLAWDFTHNTATARYSEYDLCRNNGFTVVDYGRGANTNCEDPKTRAIIFVIQ